ncbi:MAG: hypothetical protein KME60_14460 [Cyanomargarita calcarea GSE-NOS-MK-12-04C]|uniref:Uncharacterized protein n=1 Tax=Cyanomargarita calcarea GSE-NOS-MK-12-04C TaxID=2839659 RepID=A0A951QMB1_9CYAN|nr:hypothetical protein [Cyanomargarita calcarea GSE-NOS-MK-12-04C]
MTSVIAFFIGVTLIIPKVTDSLGNRSVFSFDFLDSNSSITLKADYSAKKQQNLRVDSSSDFEPLDYGSPDSQHGSGTR